MDNRYTHARICELYMGYNMPLEKIARLMKVHPNTVSRVINRVLHYKKITDRDTELVRGYFKLEEV